MIGCSTLPTYVIANPKAIQLLVGLVANLFPFPSTVPDLRAHRPLIMIERRSWSMSVAFLMMSRRYKRARLQPNAVQGNLFLSSFLAAGGQQPVTREAP